MQITLEIRSKSDLRLILQYVRSMPHVRVLEPQVEEAQQAKSTKQLEKEYETIREFTSKSDAFDFWDAEEEDLYQDFLTNSSPRAS